jgi:hypothetical protein
MQEDIVKEVVLLDIDTELNEYLCLQLPPVERRRAEATWRRMDADQENFSLRNCVKVTAMVGLAAR